MQANLADHLSPHVLSALGAGRLHAAAAADVVAHLDTCAECRQAGTALMGDSFLLRLHAARPPAGTVVEPLAPADTAGAGPSPDQGSTTRYTAPAVLPELRDHPQYEVLRELGRGGMGVVYLAKNKMMDRPEVLKVVNKQLLGHPEAAERFLREIRSAARLSHPNIVTAYSALQAGDLLAFAMEYIEGENLEQFVQAQGRLPVANACYYTSQVALGLQHAFEKGLVHRDIKPQNLILAREGKKHVVKVLDFGLAKATREGEEADRGLTGTGMMMGTPDYIAPEQTLDAARADIRADIYSLGCTLYYLLTGSPPFKGKSQFELLQAHHSMQATPLDQLRTDVPPELAAVAAKMMAKDPGARYQKPVEVAQALAPFFKAGTKALPPGAPREAGKAGPPDTAAPVVCTVVEGSATMARALKNMDTPQIRHGVPTSAPIFIDSIVDDGSQVPRRRKRNDFEGRGGAKAKRRPKWLLLAGIGGAGLLLLIVLLVVLLNAGGNALEGTWILTATEVDGKRELANERRTEGLKLVITKNTIAPSGGPGTEEPANYTVDTSTKPKQIDIIEPNRDPKTTGARRTTKGIYEVNGDELRICTTQATAPRPTDFISRQGDRKMLMTLKRQK